MSKETKHIPLWPSLIGLVTHRILIARLYVSNAVNAESCYLLDLKKRGNS